MSLRIYGFGVGNYRSFKGTELSHIGPWEKVHVIAGQNNSGKSALLSAFKRLVPLIASLRVLLVSDDCQFGGADVPYGTSPDLPVQFSVCLSVSEVIDFAKKSLNAGAAYHRDAIQTLESLLGDPAFADSDKRYCWLEFNLPKPSSDNQKTIIPNVGQFLSSGWYQDIPQNAKRICELSVWLYGTGFGPEQSYAAIAEKLLRQVEQPEVITIPSIRSIRVADSNTGGSKEYVSGLGLPEKLHTITNPNAVNADRENELQRKIIHFIGFVLNEEEVAFNVAARDHEVSLKTFGAPWLPLPDLGTGLEELLIFATVTSEASDSFICIEEPELHLHPALLRRMVLYLQDYTSNRYLIATHSPTLLNAPGVSVTHVSKDDGISFARTVPGIVDARNVLDDLGVRASDILQANYVIWVEGPSDRVYVRYWLSRVAENLVEEVHYSIVCYGGSLLKHLSANVNGANAAESPSATTKDLTSLFLICTHFCVLMDSDIAEEGEAISPTKQRIVDECRNTGNYSWVTEYRTIENYLSEKELRKAIGAAHPRSRIPSSHKLDDPYTCPLSFNLESEKGGQGSMPDKVRVAREIVKGESSLPDVVIPHVRALANEIRKANGMSAASYEEAEDAAETTTR